MKQSVIIEFLPRLDDKIEFLTDAQTEKGPSAGSVVKVNYREEWCLIRHSDHPGERFDFAKVIVARTTKAHDGRRLWQLV
jgi:hypothetical protein